jgi:hypothetical protein
VFALAFVVAARAKPLDPAVVKPERRRLLVVRPETLAWCVAV